MLSARSCTIFSRWIKGARAPRAERRTALDFDGASILVADDDRVVRRIVVVKLRGLGYDVEEAQDGQEVLDLLDEGDIPDLIITDANMPRINGLQLVRALRESEDEALAMLPIVMLTARQSERDVIEGLKAGLDDYIVKPFSSDELAARVRTVLWRASKQRFE